MNCPTPPSTAVAGSSTPAEITITVHPSSATLRLRDRLTAVAEIIRQNRGVVPTHLELLKRLRQAGVKSSKGTILNDLATLKRSQASSARVPKHITLNLNPD